MCFWGCWRELCTPWAMSHAMPGRIVLTFCSIQQTYQERCGHRGQEKEEKQRRWMLDRAEKTFTYLEIAGSWMGVKWVFLLKLVLLSGSCLRSDQNRHKSQSQHLMEVVASPAWLQEEETSMVSKSSSRHDIRLQYWSLWMNEQLLPPVAERFY